MTVLRLIFPVWTAVAVEASEAYVKAQAQHRCAVWTDYLFEAALIYLTSTVSLLSISFISG